MVDDVGSSKRRDLDVWVDGHVTISLVSSLVFLLGELLVKEYFVVVLVKIDVTV